MVNEATSDEKKDRFLQQKLNKLKPKFILLMKGFTAKSVEDLKGREQQYLTLYELQQLMISSFLPAPRINFKPEWFILQRSQKAEKVGIFLLDIEDEIDHERFSRLFTEVVRFEPLTDWVDQILTINLSKNQTRKIYSQPGGEQLLKTLIANSDTEEIKPKKKTTKLELLLSPGQMLEEGYIFPRPLSEIRHTIRKTYKPVTETSPIFALDCEMCLTANETNEVTRVSIVDEDYNLVLDTLVKPEAPIKDYLTRWSGITKEMLDPVDITLSDVRKILKKIIPRDAILCGQSLNFDLKALKTFHPYVIDTSVIYNLSGARSHKTGLKQLSSLFLEEDIQASKHGHCSIEDARATMKLVNLKLENGISFADRVLSRRVTADTPVISLNKYLEMNESDVKIFYDFVDLEMCPKFISVLTRIDASFMSSLFKLANTKTNICLLLTRDGYCYIKV